MTAAPERPEPSMTGSDREQLEQFLDYQRATVVWKCSGLTDEQARRRFVPSELTTIAGLVSHLRLVEWSWFTVDLAGGPDTWAERLAEDRDAEFRDADTIPIARLIADYETECEASREVMATLDLDQRIPFRDGRMLTPRWVMIHMIEETARHAGHIDLLRELTDGLTGE
jgi:uncharacterized damage-inducible protein DinB